MYIIIIICIYSSYTNYILGNGPCLLDYVRRNERNQSVVNRKQCRDVVILQCFKAVKF